MPEYEPPERAYDISIVAHISVRGIFMGSTAAEALDAAKGELFTMGQIEDIQIERQILVEDL